MSVSKHLSLSRKQALLHFQTYHHEEDSRQITFPRMNLHKEATCAKCKILHAYNLIKLGCSNEICKVCLLDLIHCNEIETPAHAWKYQFLIQCPFCNYIHRVDSETAVFLYDLCELPLPITDAEWIEESPTDFVGALLFTPSINDGSVNINQIAIQQNSLHNSQLTMYAFTPDLFILRSTNIV